MKKVCFDFSSHLLHLYKKRSNLFVFWSLMMLLSPINGLGQQTYTWNQTATASWTIPGNWTPSRITPFSNDILQFNNAATTTVTNIPNETIGQLLISNNTNVNLQGATGGITLNISGLPGVDLSVTTGSALNINSAANITILSLSAGTSGIITGNMTISGNDHRINVADAGALVFNSPSIFTQDAGFNGNVFGSTLPQNVAIFNSGTKYIQNSGASPFGLGQPQSKVIFSTGNLYSYQLLSSSPSFSGRTYADFQYDSPGIPSTALGSNPVSIDNLSILSGTLNINMTGTPGHTFKGNISVSLGSTLNFTPASPGTMNLTGTAAQSISNAGTLSFSANQTVNINNSNGITLNSPVTILGTLTFTSGIVNTNNPNLLIIGAGSIATGASNASFVDGPVKKIGNTAFTFPVGKPNCGPSGTVKGYAALQISSFTGGLVTDEFTAEYKRGDAMSLGTISNAFINHISRCDYWTLVRDVATTSTVNITLFWDGPINNCVTTAPYINNLGSLAVVHNNNTGSSTWDTYSVANVTSGTITTGTVTWDAGSPQSVNFGAFTIASLDINNPLPITVNYFNGIKHNSEHLLNWKVTCNTTPTATMVMERSTDGRYYSSIYSVTATVLQCQQPFNYSDNHPEAGTNYYRLKMTDAKGKVSYSTIVSLINANKGILITSIAPNPVVNGYFNLDISSAQKTSMDIIISDMQGRLVQKRPVNMIAGFNTINMNVGKLAKGTYQLYANSAGERTGMLRFVIQ